MKLQLCQFLVGAGYSICYPNNNSVIILPNNPQRNGVTWYALDKYNIYYPSYQKLL